MIAENGTLLLPAVNDEHGGITVDMKEPMEATIFRDALRASMAKWKHEVSCLLRFCNFLKILALGAWWCVNTFFVWLLMIFPALHGQGKKGVWIKLPIALANLVEIAVKVIYHGQKM